MINLPEAIKSRILDTLRGFIWLGVVTNTSGNKVQIRRRGFATEDPQPYPKLSSYTPSVNDEVLILVVPGGGSRSAGIVLGKIDR